MPELPEVETVRRSLIPALGRRITGIRTSGFPLRMNRPVDVAGLRRATRGGHITGLRRRGKYLLIDVVAGRRGHTLIVHLGMSGRLLLCVAGEPAPPHTHVVFRLAGTDRPSELRFVDPRRFGLVEVVAAGDEESHPSLARLGIDPVVDGVTGDWLHAATRGRRGNLKSLLLDQSMIAGIGNIYASEALWRAGVRPTLPAYRLSRPRADRLAAAIVETLTRAIEDNGTSLRDFVDGAGQEGEHLDYLWVYGRDGEPCLRCRRPIQRRIVQNRATFYCSRCQSR